jgi:hypothetical protein
MLSILCLTFTILVVLATNYTATTVNVNIANITVTSNSTFTLNAPPTAPYQLIQVIDQFNFNVYYDFSGFASNYVRYDLCRVNKHFKAAVSTCVLMVNNFTSPM